MPNEYVTPSKIQAAVLSGFKRLDTYRKARAMFIKSYAGYYGKEKGLTGDQPINLIFTAIRSLVPNIVMQNGLNKVVTNIVQYKPYAELLGLGLDNLQRELKLKKILRGWIVDAIFGFGITDTGLAASDGLIHYENISVDPGQIFTELVSLDDFTFDPTCNSFEEAAFMGRRIRIPRQVLLDDDECDSDLVNRLSDSAANILNNKKVSQLTQQKLQNQEMQELQQYVDVVKLWIPKANASIIIPDPYQTTFEKYIKITDYYGPKEGPYTFLSLTPPVPDNPLPIAPVSIWYDLHNMANEIFKTGAEQALAQKNVIFYRPAQADEMQEAIEAGNMDCIASENPDGFKSVSFGGQSPENEFMIKHLHTWFNYVSGNPDQMAGAQSPGKKQGKQTATLSQILQSNANIVIEDYRNVIYDATAEISAKQAWYLHTDPLIDVPLIQRRTGQEDAQVRLTPEQRDGDFIEYSFRIVAKSMSRLDPQIRAKRIMEFATNVIPAAVVAGQSMMALGQQFNIQKFLTQMGEELEIGEWVGELFNDPDFEKKLAIHMMLGPQNAGKGEIITPQAVSQNGGFPLQKNIASQETENNKQSQQTAATAQSQNFGL